MQQNRVCAHSQPSIAARGTVDEMQAMQALFWLPGGGPLTYSLTQFFYPLPPGGGGLRRQTLAGAVKGAKFFPKAPGWVKIPGAFGAFPTPHPREGTAFLLKKKRPGEMTAIQICPQGRTNLQTSKFLISRTCNDDYAPQNPSRPIAPFLE